MTTCRLCKRERAPASEFCRYHLTAKRNLDSAYEKWSEGYGGMTWKAYLGRVVESPQTGQWAREVAELLSKESTE